MVKFHFFKRTGEFSNRAILIFVFHYFGLIMFYKVKAQYIPSKMTEFYEKLTDGTIASQKPDGQEIIDSMHRARITETGIAEWSEMCFCSIPLQHERQTVYDLYFTHMTIEPANGYVALEGQPFFEFLKKGV